MLKEYILAFIAFLTSVGFVSVPLKIRYIFTFSPCITLEQCVERSMALNKLLQTHEEVIFQDGGLFQ